MPKGLSELLRALKAHYKKEGRAHLPWRKTRDPYKILVSEIMLQQTQVERVVPFYMKFLKAFPDTKSLSHASLPNVLKLWQGLGYNRRGKMLRDAAVAIEKEFNGKFPRTAAELETLPGVGPYTARAVAAFAFNSPEVFIETNIRTVFFHHLYKGRSFVIGDNELSPLVGEALKTSKMQPRDFYAALMDYGSFLKRSGVKLNSKSKHYAKQSKFEGSRRELRGQILKLLLQKPRDAKSLARESGRGMIEVREALAKLRAEGILRSRSGKYSLQD